MPCLLQKNWPKIVIILFFLFIVFIPSTLASSPGNYLQEREDTTNYTAGDHTANNVEDLANKAIEDLCGPNCLKAIAGQMSTIPSSSSQPTQNHGAIGTISNLISLVISHPPAAATQYFAYMGEKAGFVSSAYAQGFVFPYLEPILKIWVVFRNLAYLVFVLVFVIVGLMIMFRVKIDPQTTISLEQALPKLIISIILVTFSFAIAGFLIELMYLLMILAITFFVSQFPGLTITSQEIIDNALAGDKIWFLRQVLGPEGIAGGVAEGLGWTTTLVFGKPEGDYTVATFVTPILYLVILIIFLVALLKIFFLLINAYIDILKLIIFSPFQIMFEALPIGEFKMGFSQWIRSLIANLLIFPAIVLLFVLAKIIVESYQPNQQGWVAPLISAGTGILAIKAILGYGIIISMPKVGNMLKKALTEEKPKPSPMGTGAAALTQILQSLEQRRMWMAMGAGRRFEPSGKAKAEPQNVPSV
jgi:hypothetical protein